MEFTLRRELYTDASTGGRLAFEDGAEMFSLEPAREHPTHPCIPAGRYEVALTVSGRALAGTLWSPRADGMLPEILRVPGRTAIRFHALNSPSQTEGCVGPGRTRSEDSIAESRPALIELMAKIESAARDGEKSWVTVED